MQISDDEVVLLVEISRDLRLADYVECSVNPGEMIVNGYAQSRAARERAAKRIDEVLSNAAKRDRA